MDDGFFSGTGLISVCDDVVRIDSNSTDFSLLQNHSCAVAIQPVVKLL